jgi:hypothetical protein
MPALAAWLFAVLASPTAMISEKPGQSVGER